MMIMKRAKRHGSRSARPEALGHAGESERVTLCRLDLRGAGRMDLLPDTIRSSAAGLGSGGRQGAADEAGAGGAAGQAAPQDLPPVVQVEADEDEGVERDVQAINDVDEDEGKVLRGNSQDVHDDVRPIQQQVGQDERPHC